MEYDFEIDHYGQVGDDDFLAGEINGTPVAVRFTEEGVQVSFPDNVNSEICSEQLAKDIYGMTWAYAADYNRDDVLESSDVIEEDLNALYDQLSVEKPW